MINKVNLSNLERFYELGRLINSNFDKLFDLGTLIASEYDQVFGYYDNDNLVGFIHVNRLYENMDVINIVVDASYRKQGIASKLIDYVLNNNEGLESVLLEVNDKNIPAINLYKKCGFEVINVRKKYYGEDDALIMKRVI